MENILTFMKTLRNKLVFLTCCKMVYVHYQEICLAHYPVNGTYSRGWGVRPSPDT